MQAELRLHRLVLAILFILLAAFVAALLYFHPFIHHPYLEPIASLAVVEPCPQERSEPDASTVDIPEKAVHPPLYRWLSIALALLLAVLLGIWIGRVRFPGQASGPRGPSNMARFWAPITANVKQN
jgi:hypothetical protein